MGLPMGKYVESPGTGAHKNQQDVLANEQKERQNCPRLRFSGWMLCLDNLSNETERLPAEM